VFCLRREYRRECFFGILFTYILGKHIHVEKHTACRYTHQELLL
jgi:hypothetical protein